MKIDRDKLVISVEGELCAGTEDIGEALAKQLGIRCRSDEILMEARRLSGISWKLLKRYEHRRVRQAYDLTASGEDDLRIPPARDFLAAQIAACRELAEQGPCVLVDHHSGPALADRQDHIRIFVHLDKERRLEEFARDRGLRPEKAKAAFSRDDREFVRCYRQVFPGWGRAADYDVTVNAASAPADILAGHILRYLETVTRERLVHPTPAQERSA